ncbi:MAG: hypothetical protein LBJ18_01910 [Rickettsiales bacterium]|nr:hypothetical protein [Rickettsiales bacterium]
MSRLKKFLIVFLSFLPFGAGAVAPLVIGAIAGVGVIAGFSIYRSMSPVDMADAMSFFSTCWSCNMFGDIMSAMSGLLPRAYSAIGQVAIPIAISLTAVWFAWRLLAGYIGAKTDDKFQDQPWSIAGQFGTHIIKLGFIVALLAFPLPRLLTNVVIEPVFNVGLTINHAITDDNKFAECLIATAIADPASVETAAGASGAYSPNLRHNLACELANVHQMTAIGMTAGWTMMNMSFNSNYMHKIAGLVPIFPNVPYFFTGLLILALFFAALLPIPLYFLEIFINLSIDLIMLPLMLLAWLFTGWKIFPQGGRNLKSIIDDVIKNTVGIALVGVFVSFSVMFLNAMFGKWQGASALQTAMQQNDAMILMEGLKMNNDSLITIILLGLFIAMFMTSIPALIETLFTKNLVVSDKFYKEAEKLLKTTWGNMTKWYKGVRKAYEKSK